MSYIRFYRFLEFIDIHILPQIFRSLEDGPHAGASPLVPRDGLGLRVLGEAGDEGGCAQGLDRLGGERGNILLLLRVKLHLEIEILLRICGVHCQYPDSPLLRLMSSVFPIVIDRNTREQLKNVFLNPYPIKILPSILCKFN